MTSSSLLIFALVVVCAAAFPHEGFSPLERPKRQNRQTSVNVESPGIATIQHSGTVFDNNRHRLDGSGYVSKDFSRGGGLRPDAVGGSLDYLHKPSSSSVGVQADHFRHGGTDLKASGTWNFIDTPNAEVGLTGSYGRHFGSGSRNPDWGVFLGGTWRF
ncbi:hypothetical protein HUJ04_006194 [Dendroctonus ponderosae]|uniref:Attacin C-terminal domain-containing protein n=1 Tax=Dendroctonus ponderosae TaxID=77166 RepID=A0AAR5Q8H4_DENPD|nr:hypothetical protein HUJ04_006194 [Dendroctonus ponderosae]KAH1005160.1 hypothetical protein HUJ04_006194 [Dendroctonus ponderosae]